MKFGSPFNAAISRAGESGAGLGAGADGPASPTGRAGLFLGLTSVNRMAVSFARFATGVSGPARFVGD